MHTRLVVSMHTEKGHKYEILSNGKLMKCMYYT